MPAQRRNYTLSDAQLAEVEEAFKHDTRKGVKNRCRALLGLHRGEKPKDVAKWCGVTRNTIYVWHRLYCAEGLEGLEQRTSPGRPPKVTAAYIEALETALAEPPSQCGYDFLLWTGERLLAHLADKTGLAISQGSLYALLAELKYVYRRPKLSLAHLQDAEAVAQAQANWERLKGGPAALAYQTDATNWSPWMKAP